MKKALGLKEVQKGAKLYKKKEKLEKKLEALAKQYHNKTSIKGEGSDYFLLCVRSYIKKNK